MAVDDKANKVIGYYKRLDDNEISNSINNNFKRFFFYPKLPNFESIASQTINFLYKMCSAPDLLCQEMIYDICKKLNEISQKRKAMEMNDLESSQATGLHIPMYLLPRVIFIFGYIATKEWIYLQDDVYQNFKYREELGKQKNNGNETVNLDRTMDRSLKRLAPTNTSIIDPNDADSTYMGATAEDHLGEMINNICENELVTSANCVFHNFIPILIEILQYPAKYSDEYIQRAAVLALMRFMTVSSKLCADKIAFLMNILNKSKNASMKCNIIIGLADLTSRYPNTIEPWQPNFFVLLFETNDYNVRLTTLKMLSYIILQAIIRVTGEVAEMAACIVDEKAEIRDAAKEFFRQLVGCKEQEYYKVIPDIVSRFSTNHEPMFEDKFRVIVKYLFELIHKDRPAENLVEKLCGRFRNTNTERQWRDISFCLSLLNPTEKTMRRLIDNLPKYKDKLHYDEIYDCFKVIISNANKQIMKPALKDLAKEFETKLEKCFEASQNNESIDVSTIDTENVSPKNKPKSKKKPTNSRRKTRAPTRTWSSDEMDDDDDFEENIPPGRKRK